MLARSYGWTTVLHIKPKSGYLWISVIPPSCYCHQQASHDGPECLFERLLQPDRKEIPPANTNDSLNTFGMREYHPHPEIHVLKDPPAGSRQFGPFNESPQSHTSQHLIHSVD